MSATEGNQSKSMRGRQTAKKRQRVSIDLKGEIVSKIEAAAQEYDCFTSDILRRALEAFLGDNSATEGKEALATSRDTHELRRLLDLGFTCLARLDSRLGSSAHCDDEGDVREELLRLTQQVAKLVAVRTYAEK